MLTTLKGLGYPGPALLAMRAMLPTPFDTELAYINQFFMAHWKRGDDAVVKGYENYAEFVSASQPRSDGTDHAVRYMLKLNGQTMSLHIGYRRYNDMFCSALGNMGNNILEWQQLGYLDFQLEGDEQRNGIQLKRVEYRNILDRCFSEGQCQLCCQRTCGQAICVDCQEAEEPVQCEVCCLTKGQTVKTVHRYMWQERSCLCQVHVKCWLERFHDSALELERGRCEMCLDSVRDDGDSEAEDDEEYYDVIEEVEEPSAKRRRLE